MTYYTRSRPFLKKRRTRKRKKDRARNKKGVSKKRKHPSLVFGHIYSESCHHCISMKEEWSHLCARVKKHAPLFLLYDIGEDHQNKIDVFNSKYSTNLEFTGVPTIFKLRLKDIDILNKDIEYYDGERTQPQMEKWLYEK